MSFSLLTDCLVLPVHAAARANAHLYYPTRLVCQAPVLRICNDAATRQHPQRGSMPCSACTLALHVYVRNFGVSAWQQCSLLDRIVPVCINQHVFHWVVPLCACSCVLLHAYLTDPSNSSMVRCSMSADLCCWRQQTLVCQQSSTQAAAVMGGLPPQRVLP